MSAEPSAVESRLAHILDRVDVWLRFAEAKNAGAIALAGTASSALIAYLRGASDLTAPELFGLTFGELAFLASLATAVVSFLPRMGAAGLRAGPPADPARPGNLLHYADLARHEPAALARAVARHHGGLADYDPAAHPADLDLAAQISANARITVRKLRLFSVAATLALVGVVAVAASLVLRLVR